MQRVTSFKGREIPTPGELLEDWKLFLQEQDHSPGTVKKYSQAVTSFLVWFEEQEREPLTLASLTPITLIGYRNDLQQEQQKAASTINVRISALRAFCSWLLDRGYLTTDPSVRVRLVSNQAGSKREGLTNAQVHALLRQAQESRDPQRNYAIVQVLLQTGIRLSECSALVFGDIEFGERGGTLTVRAGKGNKVRSVPLNASARDAIASVVTVRLGAEPSLKAVAVRWPRPRSEESRFPLWESQKGGQLSTSAMGKVIAELVEESGSDRVPEETSAHHLRHTFARNYLAQYHDDIVGLAELLGHSSLDTTRLYSKPTVQHLSSRVEKLAINAYGG